MSLIQMQDACLAFGHVPLLDHTELVVDARERLCVVGRNGAGKSTLPNVLAGEQALDSGRLWRRDGLKVAKLAQEVPDADRSTVFEVVTAELGGITASCLRAITRPAIRWRKVVRRRWRSSAGCRRRWSTPAPGKVPSGWKPPSAVWVCRRMR